MLRVVCDLNVVVSGLIQPLGPSGRLLERFLVEGEFRVVACPRWLGELDDVLGREKFRRYRFDPGHAALLMNRAVERAPDPADAPALTDDPGDDYLVALALETGCDAIVSGDRHLLALPGPPAVWTPRELLERLEAGAP